MTMYYLVILVIDNVNQVPEILEAWESAGVAGITIIESTGVARLHKMHGYRDDIPLMPSIRSLFQSREEHHRTIFSIVEGEEMVTRLITATEAITGKLDEPETGILFSLPVSHVAGLAKRDYGQEVE
jgi:hypothetical protein